MRRRPRSFSVTVLLAAVLAAAAVAAAAAGPVTGVARAATAPRTLRLGLRGADVRALQHKLAA